MPSFDFVIQLPEAQMVNIKTISKAKVSRYPEQRLAFSSFSSMTETKLQDYWCENAIPGMPET